MEKLFGALKRNRHGHRDWLIGLIIYRHGLQVSEACDLRWDDIDLPKRTIIVLVFEISSPSLKSAALGVIASSRQQPQQSTLLSRNDIQTRGDVFLRRLHSIYPLENPAGFIRRR